jgi:hypothetical protein
MFKFTAILSVVLFAVVLFESVHALSRNQTLSTQISNTHNHIIKTRNFKSWNKLGSALVHNSSSLVKTQTGKEFLLLDSTLRKDFVLLNKEFVLLDSTLGKDFVLLNKGFVLVNPTCTHKASFNSLESF